MFKEIAEKNLGCLKVNSYPGRGIIIGMTPDKSSIVQVYWIMGRSGNSRNRVFVNDDGFVRTKAYDESKVVDPSLIIYYPVKYFKGSHIVSNGDQTDTVYDYIIQGKTFEEALLQREFEPDAPNYTPRITGIVEIGSAVAYKLAILKSQDANPEFCTRIIYNYKSAIPGFGHCIHTYSGDANPLPSFNFEPYLLPINDKIDETANIYWDTLNEENRVSLLAKYINLKTGVCEMKIINKWK